MGASSDDASERRSGSAQAVEMAVFVLLGGGLALLVPLLPPGVRGAASSGVFSLGAAGLLVCLVALVRDARRRRARSAAAGAGAPSRSTGAPLPYGPWTVRAYGLFLGILLAQPGFLLVPTLLFGDSLVARGTVVVVGAAVVVGVAPLVRGSQRRQLAAARAEHAGEAVVLVALVDLATMRLAQWARAARATLPAEVGRAGLLVADAEGLALHRSGRPARLVHRWAWDDVELSCAPHPEDQGAATLVLTLLGPVPAPRARATPVGRRRFDVTLSVRDGAAPASPTVVERAISDLTARRPTAASGSRVADVGGVR